MCRKSPQFSLMRLGRVCIQLWLFLSGQNQYYLLSNILYHKNRINYIIKSMSLYSCLSEVLLILWFRFSKKLQITSLITCDLQTAGFLFKGRQYSKTKSKIKRERGIWQLQGRITACSSVPYVQVFGQRITCQVQL